MRSLARGLLLIVILGAAFAMLAACGSDELSLAEYSEEVASLITRVDSRMDAEFAEVKSAPPDLEVAQAYFASRVDGYQELVDGVEGLNPPVEASWIHAELERILGSLLTAEEERAAVAAALTSVDQLDEAWQGPEAQAIRAAELEAIELCHAAQTQVDETQDREELQDVAWIPSQMKEVVLVSFGCPEPVT